MSDHDHAHDARRGARGPRPRPVPRPAEDRRAEPPGGLGRRGLLGIGLGVGAVALVGCADDSQQLEQRRRSLGRRHREPGPVRAGGPPPSGGGPGGGGPGGARRRSPTWTSPTGEIPEETAGPFPGDGSNGVNVLSESGVVRSDITSSFGSASGVAEGVPVTVQAEGLRPERRGRRRRCRRRRSTSGTATARAATRCTPRASPTRTTSAASRRPTPTGAVDLHQHLPGVLLGPLAAHALRGLRVARLRDQLHRTSCAPPSSRCRRTSATRSTTTSRATSRAWRTWPR